MTKKSHLPSRQEWAETLRAIGDMLLPRYCCICERRLAPTETQTCALCLMHLPYTRLKGRKGNMLERLLCDDQICPVHANSLIYYHDDSLSARIFFHFKYYHHPAVARSYGRLMAQDLDGTDFFEGIDALVPVPLSRRRLRQRGYNQSEELARGISDLTGIPIETGAVIRAVDNPTQTQMGVIERSENVKNIFRLADGTRIAGKHLLVVDDVITTGSTVRAFAHELLRAEGVRLSFISLGLSTWHQGNALTHDPEL